MFGNSMFRNDPFFNQNSDIMSEFDRMDQMMSNFRSSFGMPMMMPGMPQIMGAPQPQHMDVGAAQRRGSHRQEVAPYAHPNMFGNMFGNIGNMDSMFSQMQNDPNSHSYSSSKVVSFSSDGSGQPKYYEASSETTNGPGGVRQTRRSERNSTTGLDRMAVGHHIYDRGHVVERSRNRRTNDQEEKHDYMNMDEEEKEAFHREWQDKARVSSGSRSIGPDPSHHHRRPRAIIDSAQYHRDQLERARSRHGNRENRRVHMNSQPEEI